MNSLRGATACSGFREFEYSCNHGFIQGEGCTSRSILKCGCRSTVPECLKEDVQPNLHELFLNEE